MAWSHDNCTQFVCIPSGAGVPRRPPPPAPPLRAEPWSRSAELLGFLPVMMAAAGLPPSPPPRPPAVETRAMTERFISADVCWPNDVLETTRPPMRAALRERRAVFFTGIILSGFRRVLDLLEDKGRHPR